MKPLLFLCLLICFGAGLKAQGWSDFGYVDNRALSVPDALTYSSDSIAGYMKSNFTTDKERLRAIYAWVITNIRYDKDSMYPINWSFQHDEQIAATLRRRSGVCENYAALFSDIAVKSGFLSFVVSGYTKMQGAVNRSGHSWCAVCLENEWYLCDPTWDNESRGNTRYYLVSPAEFIDTHIPFDPLWQLMEHPITEHEFGRNAFRAKKNDAIFNFKDSAKAFLELDSLQQLQASMRRIREAGVENDRQKYWLAYNQMKVSGIAGENDMNLYNSAVSDLNRANTVFNSYVQYRNGRFIPARPDNEISALLDPVVRLISSSLKKLDQMGLTVENFQYDTGSIKDRLSHLSKKVTEQQSFLTRYLSTAVAERERLFYK